VTGYMITLSSTPPAAGATGWLASPPTSYLVAAAGSYTLYPWAKDAASNVSAVFGSPASVTVTTIAKKELSKNGGFNLYRGTGKIPLFWVGAGLTSGDGRDATTAHEGLASVKMNGALGKIKTLTQTLALSGGAGDVFTFSFWSKGRAILGRGACSAQVQLYWGSVMVYTKVVNCATGTYPAFRKTKVSFVNPTYPYTKVVIKLTYAKASGTIWFDAISLMR
jgi:hypothetical protein